jgi:hypothetical protein
MPTYGWVREDAWDAFLEGTAPHGENMPGPMQPHLPSFVCPFCASSFSKVSFLQNHFADDHRIIRPLFLINGKESEADNTIRNKCAASDFSVANSTAINIAINGAGMKETSPQNLAFELSRLRQATAWVALINAGQRGTAPVNSEYRLTFRIAEEDTLRNVEQAFLEKIIETPLSVGAVSDFVADSRCLGAGADYAEGMAAYVTGVLVKERPDGQTITSPLTRYRELFGSALQILSAHSRPLPRLLCSVMRFAINDLSHTTVETGVWELDLATTMLLGPKQKSTVKPQSASSAQAGRRRACLIDHGTGRVLDLAVRLARQDRWSQTLAEECRQVAEAATLDIMDQQKAYALWALTALRLGAPQDASRPLAQLSAIYPFSSWADSCLEAVNK